MKIFIQTTTNIASISENLSITSKPLALDMSDEDYAMNGVKQ